MLTRTAKYSGLTLGVEMRIRTFTLVALTVALVAGCTVSNSGIAISLPKWATTKTVVNPKQKKIVSHEFRCLMIEDAENRTKLPKTQLWLLTAKEPRDFLRANCVKDSQGNPEFRIVDKSTELTGVWKQLKSDHPPESLPWLILANGDDVKAIPVPTDPAESKSYLEQYAGVTP